ncbi:MAG: hypothetical protein ABMB14_34240 [Myxococcota bacterium]
MTRPPWADLRAAALLVALIGHGIYALPIPNAVKAEDLEKDWRQRELGVWRDGLARVGVELTDDELGAWLVSTTTGLHDLHRWLKTPFAPLFDLVGANQAWALFASATTAPDRLVVEIERPDPTTGEPGWVPILRRLDPCCTWREDELEYRRIRGVWDGQQDEMRAGYKGLTKWIARQAFADYPDASRVRVQLERGRSTYPWEPPDPTTTIEHQRVHRPTAVALPAP